MKLIKRLWNRLWYERAKLALAREREQKHRHDKHAIYALSESAVGVYLSTGGLARPGIPGLMGPGIQPEIPATSEWLNKFLLADYGRPDERLV